ncbi:MAG: hypothetical protein EBS05_06950 [Proteobacteria bacterium]|nr:hypothetical protein [Pseudomonadota bacterium]
MQGDQANAPTGVAAYRKTAPFSILSVTLVEDDEPVRSLWWKYLSRAADFACLDEFTVAVATIA